eukprot:10386223-Karenia_brevis.AAC.1
MTWDLSKASEDESFGCDTLRQLDVARNRFARMLMKKFCRYSCKVANIANGNVTTDVVTAVFKS